MSVKPMKNPTAEVSFILTPDEITDYEVATSEVEYLLISAGSIFDLLQSGFSLGTLNPESQGVIAMMEMVGRGFNAAAQKEGVVLRKLSDRLRAPANHKGASNAFKSQTKSPDPRCQNQT